MTERNVIGAAKAIAYAVFFIAAVMILFRGIVNHLWGSGSELGLLGAVAIGGLGIIGLAWFGLILAKDVAKSFNTNEKSK